MALLEAGADVDERDADGRTPVMAATRGNHVETVRALIEAEANVDIQDDRLDNPFLYAGAEGLLDILRLTIAAGADPSLTNRFGGTALIPASERGHVEVVEELLTNSDVDIDHVNNLGWTALLEAIVLSNGDERHQRVVQLLVDARRRHHDPGQGRRHAARARAVARLHRDRADPRGRGRGLVRAAAHDREDLGALAVLEREVGAPLEVAKAGGLVQGARLVARVPRVARGRTKCSVRTSSPSANTSYRSSVPSNPVAGSYVAVEVRRISDPSSRGASLVQWSSYALSMAMNGIASEPPGSSRPKKRRMASAASSGSSRSWNDDEGTMIVR